MRRDVKEISPFIKFVYCVLVNKFTFRVLMRNWISGRRRQRYRKRHMTDSRFSGFRAKPDKGKRFPEIKTEQADRVKTASQIHIQ